MYGNFGKVAAVTMVALVLFVVLGVSAAPGASAAPTTATGPGASEWAYGVSKNYSFGPVRWIGHPGWVRQGDLTIGFSVILTQTPPMGDASTFELSVQRTMGVLFSVQYCTPSCASPTEYFDLYYHQWEGTNSQVNLTDQGSVVEGTGPVPALAVLNTSTDVRANLTNTYNWVLPGAGAPSGQLVSHSVAIYANVTSHSQVTFAPAFGLIPLNLSGPQNWTSESAFNASGSTGAHYFVHEESSAGSSWTLGPGTVPWTVSSAGNVLLIGSYAPGSDWSWGGVNYPAVHLIVVGPFSVRDGLILIPSAADLFATSSEAWSNNQTGDVAASMTALDARATVEGHVGIAASAWQFAPASTDSMDALQSAGGLVPAMGTADPVGSGTYTLQAQPEPVTDAQQQGNCVTTGIGCPTGSTSPPLRKLLGELVVGGVAAAVVASLLVVLVAERRRLPPPPYPNANLYPPGATVGPAVSKPPAQRPGTPPTPPPEEDPLDHLW